MSCDPTPDLSRACWRGKHYAGLVVNVHAVCTGPAAGCVFWRASRGDTNPPDWLPPVLNVTEKTVIWGKDANPSQRPWTPPPDLRPGTSTEGVEWDRRHDMDA